MLTLEKETATAVPVTSTAEPLRLSHTLRPAAFVGLSLKNGLLNVVTLTLYRFWGRTEVRRRVWSSVRLNDEPFEYTGTGRELFVGFLLALFLVGLPLLLVLFGAQFLEPLIALPIILATYLLLFWLMGAGIFLAFRYTSSRTTWRGVRFQLTGSPSRFGLGYLGHLLATSLTLGWWWPEATMQINRALWGRLRFGDKPFVWKRSDVGLYGPFAIGWVAALLGYIGFIAGLIAVMVGSLQASEGEAQEMPAEVILAVYGLALVLGVLVAVAFAPFRAAVLRATAKSLTLDEARFRLDVKAAPLLWLTFTNGLLLILTLGFAAPFVQARTARFLLDRLSAEGEADLVAVRQAERGPGQGEGLADAFGLAPI